MLNLHIQYHASLIQDEQKLLLCILWPVAANQPSLKGMVCLLLGQAVALWGRKNIMIAGPQKSHISDDNLPADL